MSRIEQALTREAVEVEDRHAFKGSVVMRRLTAQQGVCALCPAELTVFICDHRVPRALGGKTDFENLQLICADCDGTKTRRDRRAIAKAARLARDADPSTRRRTKNPIRGRGFQRADPLKDTQ